MESVKNVVLVTLDALRADHLSSHGYERDTSPYLDDLAAGATRFTRAFSASSHTREAVPSILTGRFPDEAVDDRYRRSADTIAEHLEGLGFETAGFHSNPFVSRAYGFNQGFDIFNDDLYLGNNKFMALAQRALDKLRNRHYARADEINERSLGWLDSLDGDRPFFLWNHYMDPHGPYEAPAEYQRRFHGEVVPRKESTSLYQRAIDAPESITESERRRLVDLYDAEIAYTDDQLAAFFGSLDDRDLLEETLVVITADHGDAFGEHEYYEHPRYLHDELVHVPLIVAGPGVTPGTVDAPASTLDVVPTVLSAVRRPDREMPGEDLRDMSAAPEDYADRTVVSQARGEKADARIRRFSGRSHEATVFAEYDVETERLEFEYLSPGTHPDVGTNGTQESPESAHETVEAYLRAHIERHASAADDGAADDGALDDGEDDETPEAVRGEIEDRLSALGYK